mmetsp:Transcript_28717/g.43905  ORF Transcript_28717/g.43905 Transcript_28717/m.43905 type:complete len:112 (+) Transcript_28717:210-545(+)
MSLSNNFGESAFVTTNLFTNITMQQSKIHSSTLTHAYNIVTKDKVADVSFPCIFRWDVIHYCCENLGIYGMRLQERKESSCSYFLEGPTLLSTRISASIDFTSPKEIENLW